MHTDFRGYNHPAMPNCTKVLAKMLYDFGEALKDQSNQFVMSLVAERTSAVRQFTPFHRTP